MKIIKAESAGFCFGVKRAVDTVYKCTETGTDEKIYTYGPVSYTHLIGTAVAAGTFMAIFGVK